MSATLALLAGIGAAALLAPWLARRARGPGSSRDAAGTLERELSGLREQLATGEIGDDDYRLLRDRLAARLAAPAVRESRRGRAPAWAWPTAGLAAAAVIALTLVPALRERGAGDFPTGNDFADPDPASAGVAALRQGDEALARGDAERAVERYRLAVAFFPDQAEVRARLGLALMQSRRSAEAVTQLRLAVRGEPRLALARLYLGGALARAGRAPAGREQWRRFLALAPPGAAAAQIRRALEGRPGP